MRTIATAEIDGRIIELIKSRKGYTLQLPDGTSLMSSDQYISETSLATIPCWGMTEGRILIGGLGMGCTTKAALAFGEVFVDTVEISPEIVQWNIDYFGMRPNPHSTVIVGDIRQVLQAVHDMYDVILLDICNGPSAQIFDSAGWLYTSDGIANTRDALIGHKGKVAYWCMKPDVALVDRLVEAGAMVEEHPVADKIITIATWE